MKTAILIPSRFQATRLPGKPLLDRTGKPLIQHVLENAGGIREAQHIAVATDDERIAAAVRAAGGQAIMTSPKHESGTDRLAEAAAKLDADLIVNLQGDEPTVDPAAIDSLIQFLLAQDDLRMATLATPILDDAVYADPAAVKVVCDRRSRALYFSRAPIPHLRDRAGTPLSGFPVFKHIGVYAYRRDFLMEFAAWPRTPLERAENLEQLRALEHGVAIGVVVTARDTVGIDTPEDYERFVRACQAKPSPARKDRTDS